MSKFNAWMVPLVTVSQQEGSGGRGWLPSSDQREGSEAYFLLFIQNKTVPEESSELHSLTSYCDRDLTPGLTGLEELLKTDRTTGKTGTTLDHIIDNRKEK